MTNDQPSPRLRPASKLHNNSGQALLLVVLAVGVLMIVGLSIVSRSISDVTLTSREEQSLRAFSAAEAGVEEALISGLTSGTLPEGATFNVSKSGFPESTTEYVYPSEVDEGDSVVVWLMNHDDSNNLIAPSYKSQRLTVCWGKEGTSDSSSVTPAVEADIVYEGSGEWHIARGEYDPNSLRRSSNYFSSDDGGTCTIGGVNFAFRKVLDFGLTGFNLPWSVDGGLKLIKFRLLYNSDVSQSIGFLGEENLPPQGVKVDSLGVSGQSSRRIEVYSLYPEAISLFGAALYSNGVIQ